MSSDSSVKFQPVPLPGASDSWKRYLPFIFWLGKYSVKSFLISDIIGGITATIMLIPQGMGYALIAGLEPIYGLYSSLFGALIYSFFGTSGQVTVAPMAVVSLMTAETVRIHISDEENITEFAAIASAIAFQAGIILMLLGLIKGGILATMLSKPVLIGFKAGAGCLIGLSQLKFVFHITHGSGNFVVSLISVFANLGNTHPPSLILSIGAIIFLLICKYTKRAFGSRYTAIKFFPSELVIVIIGILVAFGSQGAGFDIIGDIPKGLPPPKNFFAEFANQVFWNSGLWLQSFLIAVLTFVESFAGGKTYADKRDYSLDASQELIALGACNMIAPWFQCYISGGALSRTVVVGEAGSMTPLTGFIAAMCMIIAILSLLGVFKFIPKPVLGCIVLVGVMGLFDITGMKKLWKLSKKDFFIMAATITVTLLLGIDMGVGAGVLLSVLVFVQESAKPHYSVLGRISKYDEYHHYTSADDDDEDDDGMAKSPKSGVSKSIYIYKDVKHQKDARVRPDMLMIRWDAALFFGNFSSFQKRINKQINRFISKNEKHLKANANMFCLTLAFDSVNEIDTTALELLCSYFIELKKKYNNLTILVFNVKKQVYGMFEKHGKILEEIEKKQFINGTLYDCEKYWNKVLNKKVPHHLPVKSVDFGAREESDNEHEKDVERMRSLSPADEAIEITYQDGKTDIKDGTTQIILTGKNDVETQLAQTIASASK